MVRNLDAILTLKEVAQALRLDPRTVKEVAFALGGRRIGYRWRFRWGTVLEYFSNADVETGQRKLLDGESRRERQADSLQNVPGREKAWPGMAGRKRMGGRAKRLAREGMTIPTALELLMAWGDSYLTHVQRTMSRQTYVEKKLVTKDFFAYCGKKGIHDLAEITSARAYEFLSRIKDERGANVANKYRKNLLAAWNWGSDFFEGFPQVAPPFLKVKPFPVKHGERYVPPESDVIKVFQQAEGQDLVMLLTLYFTGGRRSEIFRLTWNDVDLQKEKIRLTDNKSGNGMERVRWLRMHPELVKALKWWRDARPCKVDNVFMQLQNDTFLGQPFTQRIHFMERLCRKAHVKPFGFHAIRHKSAAITFVSSGLNAAQVLMGHYRATTTDRYTKSAGLYTDQSEILSALGGSGIGQVVEDLLKTKIPQEKVS